MSGSVCGHTVLVSHSDYVWVVYGRLGHVVSWLGCGVRVYVGGVVDGSHGEGGLRRSIPDSVEVYVDVVRLVRGCCMLTGWWGFWYGCVSDHSYGVCHSRCVCVLCLLCRMCHSK